MGEYEVEINEIADGLFVGTVWHIEDDNREMIGTTAPAGMKPSAIERAEEIARLHKHGPEIHKLDV